MLVLSRHRNESIEICPAENFAAVVANMLQLPAEQCSKLQSMIEEGIFNSKVMVVDLRGDKARIGIEAHDLFDVHREEVAAAIRRDRGVA